MNYLLFHNTVTFSFASLNMLMKMECQLVQCAENFKLKCNVTSIIDYCESSRHSWIRFLHLAQVYLYTRSF